MTDENDSDNVISIKSGKPEERVYDRTLLANDRRYTPQACPHKGPFYVDRKLGSVECGDCGALLNPIYVLEVLAAHETYWNKRQQELGEYLGEINKELEGRTLTKCTHCGNMTAIRFKRGVPRTWFPTPY